MIRMATKYETDFNLISGISLFHSTRKHCPGSPLEKPYIGIPHFQIGKLSECYGRTVLVWQRSIEPSAAYPISPEVLYAFQCKERRDGSPEVRYAHRSKAAGRLYEYPSTCETELIYDKLSEVFSPQVAEILNAAKLHRSSDSPYSF